MPTLFSALDCRHKRAVYFGVDKKFSPGELTLLKNADVIELKCSVGMLAELLMELIKPPWCLPAVLELLAPGRHWGLLLLLPPRLWGHTPSLCLAWARTLPKLLLPSLQESGSQENRTGLVFVSPNHFLGTSSFFNFATIRG